MRILAIGGENLASLAAEFKIDLTAEPLAGTGLFAITGETGAGKSTILDALCLALYGDYPRAAVDKREKVLDPSDTALQVSDPRNILRRGAGHAWAEVDFIGVDGIAYRCRWAVRRARDKASGKLQKVERTLVRGDGTGDIATGVEPVLNAVVEKTGFTFEEFRRSVLLAQGEFDAFLLADETQRAALLEKITGTEIYSRISRRVFEETTARDQSLKLLDAERKAIGVRTEVEIGAEKEEEDRLLVERRAMEANLADVETVLRGLEHFNRALEAVTRRAAEAEGAKRSNAVVDDELKSAEDLRAAKASICKAVDEEIAGLEPVWQEAMRLDEAIAQARAEQSNAADAVKDAVRSETDAKAALDGLNARLAIAENEHAETAAALERDGRHKLLVESKERIRSDLTAYERLARESNSTAEDLKVLEKDIAQHKVVIASAEKTVATNKAAISDIAARIVNRGEALEAMDLAGLTEREERLLDADGNIGHVLEAVRQRDHAAQDLKSARRLASQATSDETEASKTLSAARAALAERARAREELVQLSDLAEATLSQQAAHLRSVLMNGEPCPVCGSGDHPFACRDDAASEIASGIKSRRSALDAEIAGLVSIINQAEAACARAAAQMKQAADTVSAAEPLLAASLAQLARLLPILADQSASLGLNAMGAAAPDGIGVDLLEGTRRDVDTARKGVAEQRKKAKVIADEKDALERSRMQISSEIEEFDLRLEADRNALGEKERQQAGLSVRLKVLRDQISTKRVELEPIFNAADINATDLDRDAAGVMRRIEVLAERHVAMQKQRETLSQTIADLATGIARAESNATNAEVNRVKCDQVLVQRTEALTTARTDRAKILDGLETWPHRQAALNRRTVAQDAWKAADEQVAAARLAQARSQAALTAAQQAKADAEELVETARSGLATAAISAGMEGPAVQALLLGGDVAPQGLVARRAELSKAIDDTKGKLVLIEDARARDQEAREKAAALSIAYDEKQRDLAVWKDVNDAIGQADGAKFRRFAQSVTLGHLVALANIQLALLNPRYQLRRGTLSDLALDVVDRDMGEEIRSPRSLSGGERFLVSLALALALSGLEGRQSFVDTLFIDEGFGSLDRETLDIAITALESLQGQGRKVGVITHVPAMIEQIAVQVRVEKRGGGRSVVRISDGGAVLA